MRFQRIAAIFLICFAFAAATAREAAAGFEMRRAINVAQWFTWPRFEPAPNTGILWPPYRETPRPPNAAELADLRKAGFDTIRLPVDPAPFIVFKGERREEVYRILFAALARIHGAGLNAVVDLHPNSRHPAWGQHAVIATPDAPAFVAYKNVITEFARRLDKLDPDRVALELINEPRIKCKGADQARWQGIAKELVGSARAGSKRLALVITGACVSSLEGLLALDPKALNDNNLIYTFHFYDPFTFTHQGASFIPWPDKYLDQVPWPASKRPIEEPIALIPERVGSAKGLDDSARQRAAAGARANLQKYYNSGAGADVIENRFSQVAAWAREHGIPANRVFIGEFGVLRKNADGPGARCEDRMRWLHDIRAAADKFGFSWAYFNYDGPFALVNSDSNRTLDQSVLASLGLTKDKVRCVER